MIALGLGLWCVGCGKGHGVPKGPDDDGAGAEPWPEVPADGFVVIAAGSPVYVEPSYAAPSARLGWPIGEPPPWPAGGTVVRVTGMREGFVEVAPLVQPHDAHCERALDGERIDVRVYVSPWSLVPVTTRAVDHEFEDGTRIELFPGAPVGRLLDDEEGRFAVSVDDARLKIELPQDAVGLAYAQPQVLSPSGQPWDGSAGIPGMSYDDGEPLLVRTRFGSSEIWIADSGPWGNGARLRLEGPCLRATVLSDWAPIPDVRRFRQFDFGLGAPGSTVVLPGPAALDPAALVGTEPEPDLELEELVEEEIEPIVHLDHFEDFVEGELLQPGVGFFGPVDGTMVFEEGAPVYLTAAGPPSGTLRGIEQLRDGWVMGDRICFPTMFGAQFQPLLPVCFDGGEGRMQTPELARFDMGSSFVEPGGVRVKGSFEPGAVERGLRRHRVELRRCFEVSLSTEAAAPRRLGLELTLDLDGEGQVTAVRSMTGAAGIATTCVIESAKGWGLPAPTDGRPGRVTFTVTLTDRR